MDSVTLDHLGGLVILLATDGTIVDWNRACAELTGRPRQAARGKKLEELFSAPDERSRAEAAVRALGAGERESIELEGTWLRHDGSPRTIAFSGSATKHDGETIRGLVLTGVDITEALERSARASPRLPGLLDLAPVGVFVVDHETRMTYVNPAGCRLLGREKHGIVGRPLADFVPADQAERIWEVREQLLRGATHVAEWTIRQKGGAYILAEISASALPDGRVLGFARASHADLERAQAITHVGSWRLDVARRTLLGSREAHEIFGTPPGMPIPYESWLALAHPDDRALVEARWRAALAGEAVEVEHRIVAGGRAKWVRQRIDVTLDEHGEPLRGLGVVQDISERWGHEQALRLHRERLRVSLEASPVYVVNQDHELRYTWAYHPMAPMSVEGVVGRTDFDLVPHDEALHLAKLKRGVLESGVGARSIVHITIGSEVRALDLNVEPLRDHGGGVVGITCAAWDVTEQQREEKRQRFLADAGALLMTATPGCDEALTRLADLSVGELADWFIVDVIESGAVRRVKVATADPDKRMLAETLQRYGERLDRTLPHLVFEPLERRRSLVLPAVSAEQLESMAQGSEHLRLLHAVGVRSLITVPLVARDRLLGAIALISSDPQKRYGAWDLRLAEDLARVAALAIDNAQLYEAAQSAIAARDEILGIAAHDLRNLLSAILLHLQLLARHDFESERSRQRPLEAIRRAANRMSRLIQDMLDLSSLDAGSLAIEPAEVSPRSLLTEVAENQRERAAQAGVELRLDAAEHLPTAVADPGRLLQVLDNLVENALKFTRRGGEVVIGGAAKAGDLLFWVSDTGAGIPREHLAHIFDRFWRADGERGGAGLGLPIVKGIVEAHGGRVWVESELGRGTTFYFTVPGASIKRARTSAQ